MSVCVLCVNKLFKDVHAFVSMSTDGFARAKLPRRVMKLSSDICNTCTVI